MFLLSLPASYDATKEHDDVRDLISEYGLSNMTPARFLLSKGIPLYSTMWGIERSQGATYGARQLKSILKAASHYIFVEIEKDTYFIFLGSLLVGMLTVDSQLRSVTVAGTAGLTRVKIEGFLVEESS